jgi:two-component system nitrogen regulation response regulator GlnG
MASGQEILIEDLPSELTERSTPLQKESNSWQEALTTWMDRELAQGKDAILDYAQIEFEKIMLDRALIFTQGHKQDAAKKLGWGRNTLTRKLKEFESS